MKSRLSIVNRDEFDVILIFLHVSGAPLLLLCVLGEGKKFLGQQVFVLNGLRLMNR